MAICTFCQQEMHDQLGCIVETFDDFSDGIRRARVRFGHEQESINATNCPDCLVPVEHFHHPGCDIEQCPCCANQAVSCSCSVQFRPTTEAMHAALTEYLSTQSNDGELLVYTDVYALGEYPVTSVFHCKSGGTAQLEWWLFAEEREVCADVLRVAPLNVLLSKDPKLNWIFDLPEGKKAFRDEDADQWFVSDID